jgi:AraC family transcriptional activator of mtrCDE
MMTERSFDALSGLAPLLRMRPEIQLLCRFGAQWVSDHAAESDRWAPFFTSSPRAPVSSN